MGMPVEDLAELMWRDEPLLPELEPYVAEGALGPMLHHPLAIELMLIPGKCALVNKRYQYKRERAEKARAEGNLHSYIALHERPYRLNALYECLFEDDFDHSAEYWPAVHWVWSDSENIHQNWNEWREVWEARGGSIEALDADDRAAFEALPDEVEVWRGIDASVGNPEGMSWSLDREKAQWFANRWSSKSGHEAALYRAKVAKRDILAVFMGRGESEVVVFPESLKEVERV